MASLKLFLDSGRLKQKAGMRYLAVMLLVAVIGGALPLPALAQEQPATPNEGPTSPVGVDPDALPVDFERIQRLLSRPPAIRPDSMTPVFRIEVFGRKPTIAEILGPDYLKGPAMAGPMTHQEFLNMVTPKDVQGYAAFDNKQGMIVAATSFALQWALRQAMQKLEDARTARQKEAARKEVEEALTALRKARREAGLPDR
jgi:hypothetical protein